MWIFGGIVGLALGLGMGGFLAGLVMAALGGFGVHALTKLIAKNEQQKAQLAENKENNFQQKRQAAEKEQAWEKRLRARENRLAKLEAQTPVQDAQSAAHPIQTEDTTASPLDWTSQATDAAQHETVPPTALADETQIAPAPENQLLQQRPAIKTAPLVDMDVFDITQDLSAPLAAQRPTLNPMPSPARDQAPALNTAATLTENLPKPEMLSAPKPRPARKPAPKKPWREQIPAPLAALLFGGNALVRIGALVLFLGLGFLLKYVTADMTVPIELRYVGVALVGLCLLAVGWRLRHRRADYGQVLQGAGVGVFYLTAFAATKLHPLLPPTTGFAFLALVALFTVMLAVLQNAYPLALAAALGGFAAPVLVSSGGGQALPLLSYLALLDVSILLVAWFKAWRWLNVVGFSATFALASAWAQRYYTPEQDTVLQLFLLFFWALFTLIGVLFARRNLREQISSDDAQESLAERLDQTVRRVGRVDSALVFGVPMAAFGLQYALVHTSSYAAALAALGFAFAYLLLAHWVMAQVRRGEAGLSLLGEAYGVVGVIFATLSIPLGLEGLWTGAAWAVEAAGMYWLGQRQARPHARAFAFLVMAGACYKLLADLSWNADSSLSVLNGSSIGPLLLAAAAWVMWSLYQREQRVHQTTSDQADASTAPSIEAFLANFERGAATLLPCLFAAALALLPCLWWTTPAAATGIATLALALFVLLALAREPSWAGWRAVLASLQILSVLGFGISLHFSPSSAAQPAVLDAGWRGALQAAWIALCLLIPVGWRMVQIRAKALAKKAAPAWSASSSLALLTGVVLLHLASLFALNLEQAAWVWPLTALAVLWVAKSMAHTPLSLLALLLQVVSAGLYLLGNSAWPEANLPLFRHAGFSTPLVLGGVGFLSAWWVWGQAQREAAGARWVCLWMRQPLACWLPLLWGFVWWLVAWWDELARYVALSVEGGTPIIALHYQAALLLVTMFALSGLARKLRWIPVGQLTLLTLPALLCFAAMSLYWNIHLGFDYVPSQSGGYWLWPLACALHFYLLRQQRQWLPLNWLKPVHLIGFWLFTLLAARESQWHIGGSNVSDVASSWRWLGWVLVPALLLAGLRNHWLNRRWPLTELGALYRETAALPIALYLLLWIWISNIVSAGVATPLPYLPLLNPLELGQLLVLMACALWWRDSSFTQYLSARVVLGGLAVLVLALLTGMVLRSVHHFADVPWESAALVRSRVAQAALSITWALCAVGAMIVGNRRHLRAVWLAGAGLIVVVLLKLFTVDLADHGGLYRVISFMGVGVLILLVGYFAPIPPGEPHTESEPKA